MAYLEELLPEFKKGTKIRSMDWEEGEYICVKDGVVVDEDGAYPSAVSIEYLLSDNWELYKEPELDQDYIVKNKFLCWFWDEGESKRTGILTKIKKDTSLPFIKDTGRFNYILGYNHCRPVRRDEVTFYEDKKDE